MNRIFKYLIGKKKKLQKGEPVFENYELKIYQINKREMLR